MQISIRYLNEKLFQWSTSSNRSATTRWKKVLFRTSKDVKIYFSSSNDDKLIHMNQDNSESNNAGYQNIFTILLCNGTDDGDMLSTGKEEQSTK